MAIPLKISATKAVARRESYEGVLPVASLRRLEGLLADERGQIKVRLEAGADPAGHPHLWGELAGSLHLTCQRCLKPFAWRLEAALALRLVYTEAEEAQALHESDPYRVEDDRLPLREIVEDELLLVLPMMPRCNVCENDAPAQPARVAGKVTRKENPFAALKKMKFDGRH